MTWRERLWIGHLLHHSAVSYKMDRREPLDEAPGKMKFPRIRDYWEHLLEVLPSAGMIRFESLANNELLHLAMGMKLTG